MNKIVAYVMTKNEEKNIARCIESLSWCDQVVVGDTGSTDRTVEIAQKMGCKVLNVTFEGFGVTRNKIIDQVNGEWIVCFDADEVCTEALALEIKKVVKKPGAAAYQAPRKTFMFGQEIKYSGWGKDYRHPVLFKKDKFRYTNSAVHESYEVSGSTGRLEEPFAHFCVVSFEQMMRKEREYALLGADKVVSKGQSSIGKALLHSSWAFFRHFVVLRGFLDGWRGLTISLSIAHQTFFRYAIAFERQQQFSSKIPNVPFSLK